MRKHIALLGFVLGVLTLAVHFAIYIPRYLDEGLSLLGATIRQYSYFTILTNLGLVLILASTLFPNAKGLNLFRTPIARTTGAGAIGLVALYYHFVLSPIWNPEGLAAITDTLLHYILPSVYTIWFVGFNRTGSIKITHLPAMLAAPILYLAYIFIRGGITGEYPYPAFNVNELGWTQTLRNSAELLIFLSILCLIMIGVDRFKPNYKQA